MTSEENLHFPTYLPHFIASQKLAGESGEGRRTFHHPRAGARESCPTCNMQGQRKTVRQAVGRSEQAQLALGIVADQEIEDRLAAVLPTFRASLTGNKPVLEEVTY